MKEFKGTKGKWIVTGELDHLEVVVSHEEKDFHQWKRVSSVKCFDHHVPRYEESKANARLISAAPDLLEALQVLMERTPIMEDLASYETARQAIKKALGE